MRKISTLLLFVLCNYTIYSQTISGRITDKSLNEELIGVNIILENGNGTATDVFGKYKLKTEEGTQTITFRYIGYEDVIKEITIRKGENKVLNISLKPTSEQLNTIVVSAGRFEQKIEELLGEQIKKFKEEKAKQQTQQ